MHNDIKNGRKGRSVQRSRKGLRFASHSSPVTLAHIRPVLVSLVVKQRVADS